MKPNRLPLWRRAYVASIVAAVATAWVSGCANDAFDPETLPNQPPVARVFVPDGNIAPTSYNEARFFWSGTDVDGFVRGFHVSIGEPDAPGPWIFTNSDDSTQTYDTDAMGEVFPTLFVVAEDDRSALSDTVSVTFPLVNFAPTLEFNPDFDPPLQSFGAASFDFFGFDLDGNETLLRHVEYRFAGSDPDLIFPPGDIAADPALGWVRLDSSPTSFSLLLRDIPGGDPDDSFNQTLFVRILDEAGGGSTLEHTWQNFEAVGDVLIVDDNLTSESRDQFFFDALEGLLPGEFSVWDISQGLPSRDSDYRLTLEQFRWLIWYTDNGESSNLLRSQEVLTQYLAADLDPIEPGVQEGRLLLETYVLLPTASGLGSSFRADILGLTSQPNPRNQLVPFTGSVQAALGGALDIAPLVGDLPAISSVGLNYLGGPGLYFGLTGLQPLANAVPLWEFESYTWGGPADPTCRLGCAPVVAVRQPPTGLAKVVTIGFQLEYANADGNALDALRAVLTEHLGVPSILKAETR